MAAFGGAAWPPGRVARLARWPGIALCRAPNREGQSVPMKWVRISEILYERNRTMIITTTTNIEGQAAELGADAIFGVDLEQHLTGYCSS